MCELFGLSAHSPQSVPRSLALFRIRGGKSAHNPDGWGITCWQEGQAIFEKCPEAGHRSRPSGNLTERRTCDLLIAHVRKAKHHIAPGYLNTHP